MKYELIQDAFGVNVRHQGQTISRIDNVSAADLDEEMVEELLFGDLDEDDCL